MPKSHGTYYVALHCEMDQLMADSFFFFFFSNECKRRKLKCSGEPVCFRCARDGVQCVYPFSRHENNATEIERQSSTEKPENERYKLSRHIL